MMRDPARIPRICKKFEELWLAHPDLRFGQFVTWVNGSLDIPFYQEDDMWEAIIEERIEHPEYRLVIE